MKGVLACVASLVAALLCGTAAGLLVPPFGLVVAEFMIFPLTLAIAALFAALGAGWTGTLLASDRTSSRTVPVVLASEGAAVVTAFVVAVVLLVPAAGSFGARGPEEQRRASGDGRGSDKFGRRLGGVALPQVRS